MDRSKTSIFATSRLCGESYSLTQLFPKPAENIIKRRGVAPIMSLGKEFSVKGYRLTVFEKGYLVKVSPSGIHAERKNGVQLPEWCFQSEHAIWLTEESAPLSIRALNGDKIKQQLM